MEFKKTIIGFGASSMAGVGDSEGGFFKRMQKVLTQYQFINLGVGGNTTRDMLKRCVQVDGFQTYDLIILLGCNDFPRANDKNPTARSELEEYQLNLTSLLKYFKGQRRIFLTSFPTDPTRSGINAELFKEYVDCAREVAVKNNFEILDLYTIVKASTDDFLAPDGLHFNAQGHQMIAELVLKLYGIRK